MIRSVINLAILATIFAVGAVYLAYGEIEPCKVLAMERARRSPLPGTIAEPLAGLGASGLSESQCAADLLDSWRERLAGLLR